MSTRAKIIRITPLTVSRFWDCVDKSGECWTWPLSRGREGYGSATAGGVKLGAHRLSWIIANGQIPDGLFVCHHCDNPPFVRPDHLFLGTPSDNTQDMVRKRFTPRFSPCILNLAGVLPPDERAA